MRIRAKSAFTLVEVTLALGVAGFTLIAIFGLLPVGINSSRSAIEQTAANGILSGVAMDMRSAPPGASGSDRYSIPIPAGVAVGSDPVPLFFNDHGDFASQLQPDSRYRLTFKFIPADHDHGPRIARALVTWPAQALPENALGKAEMVIAFGRTE